MISISKPPHACIHRKLELHTNPSLVPGMLTPAILSHELYTYMANSAEISHFLFLAHEKRFSSSDFT